ncbi:hypothetical protein KKG71_05745 [Patescibacteria group bacterium]|nr:hypothetical protein [Patescibacteria group bacterium]
MEIKEFVKSVLKDLVDVVEEVRQESARDMTLTSHKESNQTVEFDIAVTAEDSIEGSGKAGIKVFQFIEGGGGVSKASKNASVSRVKFGVYIDSLTKQEKTERKERINDDNSQNFDHFSII